jgi:methyl-accepting chemotaxis protein
MTKVADTMEMLDLQLISAANMGAELAPDTIYDDAIKGHMNQAVFEDYGKRLYRYAQTANIEYIYTLIESKEGYRFVLDTPQDEEYATGKFENEALYLYKNPSDAIGQALAENKIKIDDNTDEWGSHRSVFIPKISAAGTRYVLGADIASSRIAAAQNKLLLDSLLIGLVIFIVSTSISYYAISKLLHPIGKT